MSYLGTTIFGGPAFTLERLVADLKAVLRSEGLIRKQEERQFIGELGSFIGLFAITVMHNSLIAIEDGLATPLYADPDVSLLGLSVAASVPTKLPGRTVPIATSMFSTTLAPAMHCHPELLARRTPWDFDLEVNAEQKLVRLG